MRKIYAVFYCFTVAWGAIAQDFSFVATSLPALKKNEIVLPNAFAGGLNATQFNTIDINQDGVEDLVIFDRTNNFLSTFIAKKQQNGSWFWLYAPEYQSFFPEINNWILLYDYNHDNQKDIFASTPQGVKILMNTTKKGENLSWKLIADPVYTKGFSGIINLYVASTDLPAVIDVDDDGDTDILAFDYSGNFVEFHKNFSIEETRTADNFIFRKQGVCWGNFLKEHCKDFRFDIDCKTGLIKTNANQPANIRIMHAGNSLLLLDLNADKRKDMLFGHISCNNLAQFKNISTDSIDVLVNNNYDYPASKPVSLAGFPSAFFEDVDFDTKKDLLVSPSIATNEGGNTDFGASAMFYKNTGTNVAPVFEYKQNNFLQNTMVDVGENASPLLFDYDGDDDLDLVVGNAGIRGDVGIRASLVFYKNVGTAQKPVFEWVTDDFLELSSQIQFTDIKPFLADLNGDTSPDFGWVCHTFKGLQISYIPNRAARGGGFILSASAIVQVPLPPNFQAGDVPFFADLTNDQIPEMILGKQYGIMQLYQNTGTLQTPVWVLKQDNWGNLPDSYTRRSIVPVINDLNADGLPELITADANGYLSLFSNWQQEQIFVPTEQLVFNSLTQTAKKIRLAGLLFPTFGDLNADGLPDMIAGTNAGGLIFLQNQSKKTDKTPQDSPNNVFPNPSNGFVYVQVSKNALVEVIDLLGRKILETKNVLAEKEIYFDLNALADGTYFVKIYTENSTEFWKILLKK